MLILPFPLSVVQFTSCLAETDGTPLDSASRTDT